MNKSTKKGLVPELRFPEFQGPWESDELEKLIDVVDGDRGTNYPKAQDFSQNGYCLFLNAKNVTKNGFKFDEIQFISSDKDISLRKGKLKRGDIVLTTRGSIGQFAYYSDHITYDHLRINSGMVILRVKSEKVLPKYVYSFSGSPVLAKYIDDVAFGNAQQQLTVAGIKKFPILYPCPKEQQKIADCLSSLDELLNAHIQKLNALKAHKTGLMQQLFPVEGETVPKLRFPEFRDDGDWCFDELGSKTKKVGSGITPKGGDKNYKSAGVPFVRSQNIGWGCLILENIAYIEEEVHQSFSSTEIKENDVLLNITGASIGRTAIADQHIIGGNVNQHVCIIRTNSKELLPVYLCQFILSQNGQLQIDSFQAGGNREGLNFAQIRSFSIPIPPNVDEQKKIAECLSSIDELITAQSQKIDAIKTHKKGLLQQLFPVVNEVSE